MSLKNENSKKRRQSQDVEDLPPSKRQKREEEFNDLSMSQFHCFGFHSILFWSKYVVCQICHDLPMNPISYLQCKLGHLICQQCYQNPNFFPKKCAICRTDMSHVSRNILAEKQIKKMSIECKEDGCEAIMHYGNLQKHLESEGQAVIINCKHAELECTWQGSRKSELEHQHTGIDFDVLLDKLKESERKIEELIDIHEDWRTETEEQEQLIKQSKDLFRHSNISATFYVKKFGMSSINSTRQITNKY